MTRPTKFAHVVYRTRRFAQMLDWYATVLARKLVTVTVYRSQCSTSLDKDGSRYTVTVTNFRNPIGVEYDPQAMLASLRAGAPVASFAARPRGPQSPIRSALAPGG